MGEFFSCGTMFKSGEDEAGTLSCNPGKRRNISKERKVTGNQVQFGKDPELEKQMLNNEYLKILRDPRFSDINVNFLDM